MIPGLAWLLPNPHKYRVHEYGRFHFTYYSSRRDALKFAQAKANEHGGEWVVSRKRRNDYQCVKRVGRIT